jgi:hypothetical protein
VFYTIHIDFYSFLTLYSVSVTLYDQNGHVLGGALTSYPYAGHADIAFSTSSAIYSITAKAGGQAKSGPVMLPVFGNSRINTSGGGDYWMQVNLY